MTIIKKAERTPCTRSTRRFQEIGQPEHTGFAFDVKSNGDLVNDYPGARANFERCLAQPDKYADRGVEVERWTVRRPAVGLCGSPHCGGHVTLADPMTNQCARCGTFYNGCGQRLAPPSQWGEETGESFDDNGGYILGSGDPDYDY